MIQEFESDVEGFFLELLEDEMVFSGNGYDFACLALDKTNLADKLPNNDRRRVFACALVNGLSDMFVKIPTDKFVCHCADTARPECYNCRFLACARGLLRLGFARTIFMPTGLYILHSPQTEKEIWFRDKLAEAISAADKNHSRNFP